MSDFTRPEDVPAILDIHKLKAKYFRYVDTKNWDGLAALFTADGTIFIPEAQSAPVSAAEGVALIAQALVVGVSIHHGHMPEIDITSPSTAQGIWAMEDTIYWHGNQTSNLGLEYLHGYGHYHEDYVRTDAGWCIRTMKITRLWTRQIKPARAVA